MKHSVMNSVDDSSIDIILTHALTRTEVSVITVRLGRSMAGRRYALDVLDRTPSFTDMANLPKLRVSRVCVCKRERERDDDVSERG